MLRSVLSVVLGSALLLSCARPTRLQLQPLPLDHPANPEAPESPMEASTKTLRDGPGVGPSPPAHAGEHDHQKEMGKQMKDSHPQAESLAGKVYTCPNHSKVKASTPGRCPECGTALEKEQPE